MRLLGFCSCRRLCALIQMCTPSLDETAVHPVPDVQSDPDVHPAKVVRHAESCMPCACQDNLQAVHHGDSCVPCGELHALRTAVLPADSCAPSRQLCTLQTDVCTAGSWDTAEASACRHLAGCQHSGLPAKLLGRLLSNSFLSKRVRLSAKDWQREVGLEELFKEQSQKLLWLQIREDGDVWQRKAIIFILLSVKSHSLLGCQENLVPVIWQ